jgi:hypothetical protein
MPLINSSQGHGGKSFLVDSGWWSAVKEFPEHCYTVEAAELTH